VWNRCYLLITPILSFILPFIKIDAIRETIPTSYTITLPEILLQTGIGDPVIEGGMLQEVILIGSKQIPLSTWILSIWGIGVMISCSYFMYKFIKIQGLKKKGILSHIEGFQMIILPNTDVAFSFFNTIFLGADLSDSQRKNIILHEIIHIKERHSLDMLFFEVLRIVCWFNPLVYIYQNKMMLLQEYTADAKAVSQNDKKTYYQSLLSHVFKTENISFINTFFNHSLIKKRIIMLQKTKSRKIAQIKYAFILPLILSMLVYVSCSDDNVSVEKEVSLQTQIAELQAAIQEKEGLSDAERDQLSSLMQEVYEKKFTADGRDKVIEEREYIDFDDIGVPYALIDQVPVYPGCENTLTNAERKACMAEKVSKYVNRNFDVNLAKKLNLKGVNRIFMKFKINKEGDIIDIMARAPHPELEREAIRIIKGLPNMQPGQQDGVPTAVLYSLPITFKV